MYIEMIANFKVLILIGTILLYQKLEVHPSFAAKIKEVEV